jgi:choice-of-anchor A domain-containing protein
MGNAGNASSWLNLDAPTYVKGTTTQTNFNGGKIGSLTDNTAAAKKAAQYDAAATSTDFAGALTKLSTQLSTEAHNSTVTIANNTATFDAIAGKDGVAVFDITGTTALNQGSLVFKMEAGVKSVIINVDATSVKSATNFANAANLGGMILWNFYDAKSVEIDREFGGTVLAPNADFTNGNAIDGDLIVKNFDQHGEVHSHPYTGDVPPVYIPVVPEPETYAMLMAGLGLLGAISRRRRG